ncbi:MAG: beta-N-acetylhexosaminidase [Clostridia bacterium]|nr:beta-N-acetylhexosaminidase [Clostridia bacterium]
MDYKHFGVMLDCSRNAVPNVPSVKKLIDALQKMGYNTLELYTEDTLTVEGEPYFGYLRGRYSREEIKEIDAYAAARGIELIPCIQTLAHFTNSVKLPRFWDITDVDDILLIDEPETYEFLERVFAELANSFTSRNVNIGMDEAHHVGLGKYFEKHGACDRFELLTRHLSRVAKIAEKYGFTAHMWSDMFFRLACGDYYNTDAVIPKYIIEAIPDNVELTYWDYYHIEKSHYDANLAVHKKFGKDLWFAGGAWTWLGYTPHARFALGALLASMQSVRENNIQNVLVTLWGDNGGECAPFSVLQVLYAARRYADGEYDTEKICAEFDKLFGISYSDFCLLELPDIIPNKDKFKMQNPAKALLYCDPFVGVWDIAAQKNAVIPYGEYAKQLKAAIGRTGEFAYLFRTTEKLCRVLELKAYLGVNTRKAYRSGDKKALKKIISDYAETEKRVAEFFETYKVQWHTVNKPFGFEIICARLGGLKQRLLYCKKQLQAYVSGKLNRVEELEEEILPLSEQASDNLYCNQYSRIVSPSEL